VAGVSRCPEFAGGETILLPSGSGRLAGHLRRRLADRTLSFLRYRTPEEALNHFVRRGVDLIILPSAMPQDHLVPLVSLARSQRAGVPLIYLVEGTPRRELREYLLRTGFDSLPLRWTDQPERLVLSVRNALDHRRQQLLLCHREEELEIIDEVGKTIISTLELKKVLNIIMQKTKELVRSEAWSLLLVDEQNSELLFSVAIGSQAERLSEFRLKIGQGIAGWVAREGKPIIVHNVREDPRFFSEIDQQLSFKTTSVLCVPLESRGKILGVIEVINKMEDGIFSDKDLSLVTRLAGFAAIAIDNARLYQQTRMLGMVDELTKLYNSRFFNQFLDNEIRRCQRYDSQVSLIFMDMDYFKTVNDRFGHLMGSKVLYEVAQIMKGRLREVDVVARYGGDEFLVILPETSIEDAAMVAERIRVAIQEHEFLAEEGLNIRLTASFGISSYPRGARSKDELIRKADHAMYRVKNMNRNGVWVADDGETVGKTVHQ
jgi:diguanylate cyclase (GGDEF)-like protein